MRDWTVRDVISGVAREGSTRAINPDVSGQSVDTWHTHTKSGHRPRHRHYANGIGHCRGPSPLSQTHHATPETNFQSQIHRLCACSLANSGTWAEEQPDNHSMAATGQDTGAGRPKRRRRPGALSL
jgi:hypothetical protein